MIELGVVSRESGVKSRNLLTFVYAPIITHFLYGYVGELSWIFTPGNTKHCRYADRHL